MSVQKISFAKALNTALADALKPIRAFWSSVRTWAPSVAFSASPTA